MSKVTVIIDGREIKAPAGRKLLWVALENGIYIPNLCAVEEYARPPASCRLCFVQVEGREKPVTSCTLPAADGLAVQTRSPRVDRLVRTAFELLLSDHRLQCASCPANRACELQKIARERKLKLRYGRFPYLQREPAPDDSPQTFAFDPSRCVLCGRCIWADQEVAKIGAIGFSRRGINRSVTTFKDVALAESPCNECGLCVKACPVGVLYFQKTAESTQTAAISRGISPPFGAPGARSRALPPCCGPGRQQGESRKTWKGRAMGTSTRVTIRPVKKKETVAVRRLINRTFPLLQRLFVALHGRDILAAFQGDQMLGGVVLKTFYLPGKGKCGHVEWLITAPEARGSGVGQSLLDAAIKLLQKKKVAEIFAVIDGHNIASANLFASRDFSLLSPGEQLRRYRFNLLLLWLHTFHYMDVGHFLWARPASPGQGSAAGQWFGNLVASIIIALLARWRLGGFASLPAEVMAATALSFVIIFGAREAAMQLTARLRGLKARYRAWESGLFFNLILALLFGWFFPVTGSIYPGEEKWRCREHKRSLGPAALAGALAVLLFAWAVPFYYLVLGGEPHPLLDTFATLAFMIAFFDIALPFFPFSGYNGRRLWDWNIMSWVIPAVLVALLFAV